MNAIEIRKTLESAIHQFEKVYPEWVDFKISMNDNNTIEIYNTVDDVKLASKEAQEVLNDFNLELKKNGLMTEMNDDEILVLEYYYVVEDGLDDLADEIEMKLSKNITSLKVYEENGKPVIKFKYLGNISKEEKNKIKQEIIDIAKQYSAEDEDSVFAEIAFDDYDEIIKTIEADNFTPDEVFVDDGEEEEMLTNKLSAQDTKDEEFKDLEALVERYEETGEGDLEEVEAARARLSELTEEITEDLLELNVDDELLVEVDSQSLIRFINDIIGAEPEEYLSEAETYTELFTYASGVISEDPTIFLKVLAEDYEDFKDACDEQGIKIVDFQVAVKDIDEEEILEDIDNEEEIEE